MVSDVLSDAVDGILNYMRQGHYQEDLHKEIAATVDIMNAMRQLLDYRTFSSKDDPNDAEFDRLRAELHRRLGWTSANTEGGPGQ